MNRPVTAVEVKAFVRSTKDGGKLRSGDRSGLYLMRRGDHFYWRYDFRQINGRRSTTEFGTYPAITLAKARELLADIKSDMRKGIYPSTRRAEREAQKRSGKLFGEVTEEYLHKRGSDLKPNTLANLSGRIRNYILPTLKNMPVEMVGIDDIRKSVLSVSSPILARSVLRDFIDIMRFAKACGFMEAITLDSVRSISEALPNRGEVEHRRAVISPKDLADVLKRIESIPVTSLVGMAARLLPHLFVRVSTLTGARWSEFDLPGMIWRIPGEDGRMKGVRGKEPGLDIPLSLPVISLLRRLQTMRVDGEPFLFPGPSETGHMNKTTVGKALVRCGIPHDVCTPHGFRTTAATLLRDEGGFPDDVIERSLAHVVGNAVARSYDRSKRLEERRRLLSWWSAYLDALRDEKPLPVSPMLK